MNGDKWRVTIDYDVSNINPNGGAARQREVIVCIGYYNVTNRLDTALRDSSCWNITIEAMVN